MKTLHILCNVIIEHTKLEIERMVGVLCATFLSLPRVLYKVKKALIGCDFFDMCWCAIPFEIEGQQVVVGLRTN